MGVCVCICVRVKFTSAGAGGDESVSRSSDADAAGFLAKWWSGREYDWSCTKNNKLVKFQY